ncbi:hypothetical protein V7S48_27365 [Mesorhizobium sp. CCNWLW176]
MLLLLSTVTVSQAAAATIYPAQVVYGNWAEETEEASVCEIVLDVGNSPSREVVKFIMFAGYNKSDGAVLAGFLIAAAETMTTDRSDVVQISDAALNSATFTSRGQLGYEVYDDGTVMAPTDDPEVATSFINAVLAGNFELSFVRSGSGAGTRIYKIVAAPPAIVTSNLVRCMESLAGGANLAQSPASDREGTPPQELGSGLEIAMDQ